ncbi:MAG: PEGA domain-containing protein [Planctomycetes bacterium]|nr:PEGA domain-containing protein [Planctomycetota bacterium]
MEGLKPVANSLLCERCGRGLETDDAVSIIEGVCLSCRSTLRGLIQPLRADQLISGKTLLDDDDDFLAPIKPRFKAPEIAPPLVAASDNAQELRGLEPSSTKNGGNEASKTTQAASKPRIETATDKKHDLPKPDVKSTPTTAFQSQSSTNQPTIPIKPPIASEISEESKSLLGPSIPAPKTPKSMTATPVTTRAPLKGPSMPAKPPAAKTVAPAKSAEEREDRFAAAALAAMTKAQGTTGSAHNKTEIADVVEALESAPVQPPKRSFQPPTPPFVVEPAPRNRRRRVDLLIGTTVGLMLTLGVAYYFLNYYKTDEQLPLVQRRVETTQLSLTVTPPFASVKLDGQEIGPADSFGRIAMTLPAGDLDTQMIEISAEGHHGMKQPVSAFLGAPDARVALMRMPYELTVATNPPDAQVLIDGELRGVSPLSIMMDPSKQQSLTVRHAGFADVTQDIEAPNQNDSLALSIDMTPAGQMLAVTTDPPSATIRIDGRACGTSPLEIELDPSQLGKTIEIAATLDGHDNARIHVKVPEQGGGEAMQASLALATTLARVNVYTDPPDGRVIIAGKDFGASPVLAEFDPTETGKSIVVEASMGGTHFGRQELMIPPAGEPKLLMVPMSFGAQRVVFALASPMGGGGDHFALIDQLVQQIQSLGATQRFAIVAATDNGIETWPGGLTMEAATSEQKVRAYDMARSSRPTREAMTDALLRSTLAFQPTTVWLFIEGDLNRATLERFSESLGSQQVSINLIRATAPADESWFEQWTAAHRGTFTLLGRDNVPTLAVKDDSDEE